MSRGSPSLGAVVLALVVVLAGAGHAAPADEAQNKAMEHFRKGRKLYQVSEYRSALEEFKRGYLFKEDPVFLFNIGQCHRQLGERDEAITFYKRYLTAQPRAENRAQVEQLIREVQSARPAEPAPAPPVLTAPPPAAPPAPRFEPVAVDLAFPTERTEAQPAAVEGPSVFRRWWFWTIVGGAVAAGTGVFLLTRRQAGDPTCPPGVKC